MTSKPSPGPPIQSSASSKSKKRSVTIQWDSTVDPWGAGVIQSLVYSAIFTALAFRHFARRDVTS